jgi:AsmA protein
MSATEPAPKPRKRRWLWILGGLIMLILLIGLIVPMFINVDKYRPEIEAAISGATGRKVSLGTIHARLLPSASVVLDGFQLSNPSDFASGNLLSMDQVQAGVSLLPLLHGDIHVTSVTLVRPKLDLLQDENGKTNYTFPAPADARAAGAHPATSSSSFSLDSIDSISLDECEISLEQIPSRGAKPFTVVAAHKVTVTLSNIILGGTDPVKQWHADANLKGVSVDVGALAMPAVFDSGDVKLAAGALNATFQVSAGKVASVKGTLHVPDVTNAVTTFELSTPLLDADALLASIRATPETHPSGPVAAATAAAPSDALLAQGKISAERVSWAPYQGGNANAEIHVYGDRMEVMPASMVLYGGTLQISARTDAKQKPERYSANIQLRSLDLGRMLAASNGGMKGKMTGFAEIDLQLLGSSGGVWQKSLTGNGKLSIKDGKLPGVNLVGALGTLAKAAGVNETTFSSIAGDIGVADGRVTTKQTRMDSSSGEVELSGGFNLMDQSMNYDGKATITPSGGGAAIPAELITGLLSAATNRNISSITVPFSIGGTLSDPKFRPGKGIPNFSSSPKDRNAQADNPIAAGLGKLLGGKHH